MSHLEAAKALVAEHIAASNQVFQALGKLSASSVQATQAAVATATSDLQSANDLLTQQVNASLAQLKAQAAEFAASTSAAAPAAKIL